MNRYIILLVFLVYSFQIIAQDINEKLPFEVLLKLETDTIRVNEPIYYTISLRNTSEDTITISRLWIDENSHRIYPTLQYKDDKDTIWKSLSTSSYGKEYMTFHTFSYNNEVTLLPNQTVSKDLEWVSLPFVERSIVEKDTSLRLKLYEVDKITSKVGQVKLRITRDIYSPRMRVYSNIVTQVITEHKVEDKKAEEWLNKNLVNPEIIYLSTIREGRKFYHYNHLLWVVKGVKEIEKIEEFIQLFPNSSFTPWAKLYICDWINRGFYYSYFRIEKDNRLLRNYSFNRNNIKYHTEIKKAESILNTLVNNKENYNRFFEKRLMKIYDTISLRVSQIKVIEEIKKRDLKNQKNKK